MQLIRYRECPSTTWKNGGGSTKQLLISPSHADLSDFDYRISIASVSSSGPFSLFIGIDRQLCLLEGEGLKLHIQGDSLNSSTLLTPNNAPFNFKGETQIESQLLDDPVLDFNVMTKRDKYSSNIEKICINDTFISDSSENTLDTTQEQNVCMPLQLLLCLEPVIWDQNGHLTELERYDLLLCPPGEPLNFKSDNPTKWLCISLSRNKGTS
ncbi:MULTISPECIES: HutD/Ves family protein [Shewanella]|uniref:HutD/Ves family protein n=1 Tax=Shewanella TaxID=22 RepID=UPI000DFDCE8C|nr:MULTISPECIES: HutD family protein [Shewanella]MCK7631557.1 HutD family protein [Shewanella sp. JNE9-1]MCK7635936.1 HutD family protein [Shewanella sp. JNE17]MCK7646844.1 HutD family protein [Shewanella sp. JNE3-1]MCK7651107.1 HutD family protein [Shewanella sp. JNE8]MCK7654817.1 HutD family protein [Shewanella sp. JNE4-1]